MIKHYDGEVLVQGSIIPQKMIVPFINIVSVMYEKQLILCGNSWLEITDKQKFKKFKQNYIGWLTCEN